MSIGVKELLAEANAVVPKLSPTEAIEKMKSDNVLVVDVRDPSETKQTGTLQGAANVSRGMLEFRADVDAATHYPAFQKDKTILVYCASGGRAALAGKRLKDMGYSSVYNIGGFKELADAGLPTENV